MITQVTPKILIFGFGIHFSPRYNPTIAITLRPIAPSIGSRTVPTIVPISDHEKIMAISSPKPNLFSPCTAKSVTLSISGAVFTVPSFWIAPARSKSSPPLEKISAISPIAISFSSSTSSTALAQRSSCSPSSSTINDETSIPRALENDRFLMISSRESFLSAGCSCPLESSVIQPVV